MSRLRILADENMPALELFDHLGTVRRVAGRPMDPDAVAWADVLLVRSVTRVDEALLSGTPVRFVGSATIGTDHVDLPALAARGIPFVHAPGCNAAAVAEYVLQCTLDWMLRHGRRPEQVCGGIIGLGNVGRRVARLWQALGVTVRACDPPRQRAGETGPWSELDQVLTCDLISCHVPAIASGPDRTHHLLDAVRLSALRAGQLLINTSRGPVVDNQALLYRLQGLAAPEVVLDVWEGEPLVPAPLLERVRWGTPHVAGYSVEGKVRGTWMLYQSLCQWLGSPPQSPWPVLDEVPSWTRPLASLTDLQALLQQGWRIDADDGRLRERVAEPDEAVRGRGFDLLRKDYPPRREVSAVSITGPVSADLAPVVSALKTLAD